MSGAPSGRYFEVTFDRDTDKARTERYYVEPRVLSESTIERLKAVLVKRRREHRRNLIEDFNNFGKDLPKAAQEAFAKELFADAKADVDIDPQKIMDLLTSIDSEALATILHCCVPSIETFEEAKRVLTAVGSLEELLEVIMDVMTEETEKAKNSPRQPEKA